MADYQTSLNLGFSMTQALTGVTNELEMAILRVVMFHVGAKNKISRSQLVAEVHAQGFKQDERTVRLAVSEMRRRQGIPIAGTGGVKGGYQKIIQALVSGRTTEVLEKGKSHV